MYYTVTKMYVEVYDITCNQYDMCVYTNVTCYIYIYIYNVM